MKPKPNEPCACGSGKKYKKCCAFAVERVASPTSKEAMDARASTLLAQKAAFIANGLGLDPTLPVADLMAAASKKMGMTNAAANLSASEMKVADGLIAAEHARQNTAQNSQRAPQSELARNVRATCLCCGQTVAHTCSLNGCCAKCNFQTSHFERLGQNALSTLDTTALTRAGGPQASTYGEVTALAFRRLCTRMALSASDVFVDCGSGTGRLVTQAVRECHVRAAIGVELSSRRHDMAVELAAAAGQAERTQGGKGRGRAAAAAPHFLCADCADPSLWMPLSVARVPRRAQRAQSETTTNPPSNHTRAAPPEHASALVGATAVFTCSVLFDEGLMRRLARCIEACPTVRVVASFQPFPVARGGGLRGFVETLPPEQCETSWTVSKHECPLLTGAGPCVAAKPMEPGSAVHIYVRTEESSAAHRSSHAAGLTLVWSSTGGGTEWAFVGLGQGPVPVPTHR